MDAILPIVLQFAAGTAAALALGWLVPVLGLGASGALTLGGLGGVIVGELKDHITGAHHMDGGVMPGMTMAPATSPSTMLLNLIWGAGGGALFLVLAYAVRKLVPEDGGR